MPVGAESFLRGVASCLAAPLIVITVAVLSVPSSSSTPLLDPVSFASLLLPPLALSAAFAFFAVACYVTLSEHPARMSLTDDTAALLQWKPSYKRAAAIQAPLAALASLLGAACWRSGSGSGEGEGERLYLLGSAAAAFNLPFTLLVILPTNNVLLAAAKGNRETRRLLVRWGHLHFVRTIAGGVAAAAFVVAVAREEAQRGAVAGGSFSSPSSSIASWGPIAAIRNVLRLSKSDYGV